METTTTTLAAAIDDWTAIDAHPHLDVCARCRRAGKVDEVCRTRTDAEHAAALDRARATRELRWNLAQSLVAGAHVVTLSSDGTFCVDGTRFSVAIQDQRPGRFGPVKRVAYVEPLSAGERARRFAPSSLAKIGLFLRETAGYAAARRRRAAQEQEQKAHARAALIALAKALDLPAPPAYAESTTDGPVHVRSQGADRFTLTLSNLDAEAVAALVGLARDAAYAEDR